MKFNTKSFQFYNHLPFKESQKIIKTLNKLYAEILKNEICLFVNLKMTSCFLAQKKRVFNFHEYF